MIKLKKSVFFILALLVTLFFLGPSPEKLSLDISPLSANINIKHLDSILEISEDSHIIKPDNHARIIWNDSFHNKTEYALVYLPGFTATYGEGDPIHKNFAKRYGMNAFIARSFKHGLKTKEALLDFTAQGYIQKAKEAIAFGKIIGEKVIVMSTSTGGTLSLLLASEDTSIHSLILYSPNIDIYDPTSEILTWPWGLQVARLVSGSKYREYDADSLVKKYWYNKYRLESLVSLKQLLEETMTESTFKKVSCPIFLGYYYKDEEYQDKVVSVKKMKVMFEQVNTPKNLKRKIAYPEAGDHIIASYIRSNPNYKLVASDTYQFAKDILNLHPVNN